MMRLALSLAVQLLFASGALVLIRGGNTRRVRVAGVAAVISLVPLMVLGFAWPSIFTILALIAVPAVALWAVTVVSPRVLERRARRRYAVACVVVAVLSLASEVWWLGSCPSLTLVVPDGFAGEVRLVQDAGDGVDLEQASYRAIVPATGELRVRDMEFLQDRYNVRVVSSSGDPREFTVTGSGRWRLE